MSTHLIGKSFAEVFGSSYSYLTSENILYKMKDGKWLGKRSVWCKDRRACWLEDTTEDNISKWWCGKEEDYNEVFTDD